ncbi:MAG: DUF1499 domain-containing protein [Pseudomonadota bacterium]
MKVLIPLVVLAVVIGGAMVWLRLRQPDPAWHVDPMTVTKPATPNNWLLAPGGDGPVITLPLPVDQAAARVAGIAAQTPRTVVLAGQGDHVTYLTRSALMGFMDTTSVRITPTDTGSEIALFALSHSGGYDWGVSQKRATDWADRLTR